MTSWVVADSGIFVASVLQETFTPQAQALVRRWAEGQVQIGAPVLFRYELVSVMRKAVSRNLIQADDAASYLETLLSQPVVLFVDKHLLKRAYELATGLNRPAAYDSQYLAVAERLECEFWTADERLFNSVKNQLAWVKWVGNIKTEAPA